MTTTVTVEAHCGNEKEVHIEIKENGDSTKVLQNGDKHVLHVYDNKSVTVREILKQFFVGSCRKVC